MSKEPTNNTPLQWDFIVEKIRQEQCVLVLGPEAYRSIEQEPVQASLLRHLDIEHNPNVYKYYSDDEFYLFEERYKRTLVCHQIKAFYQNLPIPANLEKLAKLPFHIYLTVTPDQCLQKAFELQDFNYQAGYYKRNKDPQIMKTPNKKMPLVYNVFGSIESEESMILSHDDLFDYFKSIFAQQSMPDKLKIQLQNMKNFIFLGVSFEKWYMQLLLRELEIHNRQYEFIRYAAGQDTSAELSSFCLDQFQIQFVSANITGFIDQLLEHFPAEALRQPSSGDDTVVNRARKLVAKGRLQEAIEEVEDVLEDTDLQDQMLQISGRHGKLKRRIRKGILREEEKLVQENTLADDLLALLQEAKNLGL